MEYFWEKIFPALSVLIGGTVIALIGKWRSKIKASSPSEELMKMLGESREYRKEVREDLEKLRTDVDKFREENSLLENQIKELRKELELVKAENEKLRNENANLKARVKHLEEELKKYQGG